MPVVIEDSLLQSAHLDETGLKRELAVLLFAQERLTLGQASRFAGVGQLDFQALIASRGICVHYDVDEFRQDVATIRQLRRR